jgi:hypothetical protein
VNAQVNRRSIAPLPGIEQAAADRPPARHARPHSTPGKTSDTSLAEHLNPGLARQRCSEAS